MRFIDRFFLSVVCFLSVTAICTSQLQPTIAGTSSTAGTQFNNGMILLGITGNEIDTLPPVLTFSEECGDVLCRATELRDYGVDPNISAQVDQGIFDIFIRDSVNSNYKIELITSPKISPLPKITTFDFKLVVKDRTQDAKAVLVVIDRAGKFVEETFSYKAVPIPEITPSNISLHVYKADTTMTTTILIKEMYVDTMTRYVSSIQLTTGTAFKIKSGGISSRFALPRFKDYPIVLEYNSLNAPKGDTLPETDTLKITMEDCRLNQTIPLQGTYARSSVQINTDALTLRSYIWPDHYSYNDSNSVIITNITNTAINIESIYVEKDSAISINSGKISSPFQLAPGEKHVVVIQYSPDMFSRKTYTDSDILHVKIQGETERLVPIEGSFIILLSTENEKAYSPFSIMVTPNPANENVLISLNGNYSNRVFMRIYDAIGREMPACAAELESGTGVLIPNITALPIGTYRLVATTAAGIILSTKLLLIQR